MHYKMIDMSRFSAKTFGEFLKKKGILIVQHE